MKKFFFFFCALICSASAVLAETYVVAGATTLFGGNYDAGSGVVLEQQSDGSYVGTKQDVLLPSGTYGYKFCTQSGGYAEGQWTLPSGAYDNFNLSIVQGGVYDVTFTLSANLETGEAVATLREERDDLVPEIKLHGQFYNGEWKDTDPFIYDDDYEIATLTLEELPQVKDIQFGMKFGDQWAANGALITAAHNTTTIWEESDGNNMILSTVYGGTYVFTYTLATGELVVTYPVGEGPEPIPTLPEKVTIAGDFNGWDTGNTPLTNAEDGRTASITLYIDIEEPEDYEFKILVDGTWHGNSGTMERGNSTDWEFLATNGSNCTLKADIAGDYTFTWEHGNTEWGTLSVTYPPQSITTSVANTDSDNTMVTKVVRNGQVFIIRDGVTYNVIGLTVE